MQYNILVDAHLVSKQNKKLSLSIISGFVILTNVAFGWNLQCFKKVLKAKFYNSITYF